MGFGPTWLRRVSPLLHKTTLTTASNRQSAGTVNAMNSALSAATVNSQWIGIGRNMIIFYDVRNKRLTDHNSIA